MIPNNFLYIWHQPWQQDAGENFVCNWQKWHASVISTVCCITLLINWYANRLLPLISQFLLIPHGINKFMVPWWMVLPPTFVSSAGIGSVRGDFYLFSLSIAISTPKALESGTRGSASCISACLMTLIQCAFNIWEKWFLNLAKILWECASRLASPFFTIF